MQGWWVDNREGGYWKKIVGKYYASLPIRGERGKADEKKGGRGERKREMGRKKEEDRGNDGEKKREGKREAIG